MQRFKYEIMTIEKSVDTAKHSPVQMPVIDDTPYTIVHAAFIFESAQKIPKQKGKKGGKSIVIRGEKNA